MRENYFNEERLSEKTVQGGLKKTELLSEATIHRGVHLCNHKGLFAPPFKQSSNSAYETKSGEQQLFTTQSESQEIKTEK